MEEELWTKIMSMKKKKWWISGVLPDVSTVTVFKGVTPFWCVDILRLLILVLAPGYVLLLPNLLYH